MKHRPLLSDIPAQKIKYEAGDKIVATVSTNLTSDQSNRILKAVHRFASTGVSVILFNRAVWQIKVMPPQEEPYLLSNPSTSTEESKLGVASINLTRVEFKPGTLIVISGPNESRFVEYVQRWVGPEVEVIHESTLTEKAKKWQISK